MSTTASEKRAKKLEQVRLLMDKAASTPFGPEADALQEKAEQIMLTFSIDQWELNQLKPREERTKPESRHMPVCSSDGADLKFQFINLFNDIATHKDCRAVYSGMRWKDGGSTATIVGYPEDLDMVELMFTVLSMQMIKELKPEYDHALSLEENIYKMKSCGMKWEDIFALCGIPFKQPERGRTFAAYKRYCVNNDLPQINVQPKNYIRQFCEGFTSAIYKRLREIRSHQEAQTSGGGTSVALVLRDKGANVQDLFDEMYPKVSKVGYNSGKTDWGARKAGHAAGERADLGDSNRVSRDTRRQIGS